MQQPGGGMNATPQVDSIEIRVDQVAQLFDTLDPLPFNQKDLGHDAEDFIVGWARELPRDRELRILLHLPAAEMSRQQESAVEESLQHFFAYRADVTGRDLRDLFRVGRRALAIGLAVLLACMLGAEFLSTHRIGGAYGELARQSLLILGWVANWRPLEIFLYDWWPVVRRRDLYRRLARARVAFVAANPATNPSPVRSVRG
jgi:hypothetical protein